MLGEALKRKLKKDISFALRRGTIAQVTTLALDGRARPARRRGRAAVNYNMVWVFCHADAVGEGLLTGFLPCQTHLVDGELCLGGALGGLVARPSSASRVVTWAIVP